MWLKVFCRNINRRKSLDENLLTTELRRCLGILDLTLLGISGMLGAGIYVLTGAVAKNTSGPAVPISYLLAAFAAFLSALCYAEFGARIPTTGSSYIFTYVTMGELWGFLMGWNMILEHGVGSASVAKAWSGYLDSVMGYPMKTYFQHHVTMGDGVILASYPDFLALGIIVLLCVLVACGVNSSNKFNIAFALINVAVVGFIIITGFFLADIHNWTSVNGGFAPFGFAGIVAGASRCFYAYAGFDVVASSCEEARNPRRDIPIALGVSLIIVTIAYFGISSMLTLMVPWDEIVPKSAFPDAYGRHEGWKWAQIIVTIGALCTMTTAMFSGLFVLPRILYAISKDGLLCPLLSSIHERNQVPVYSVMFSGALSGLMALLFDLETLVQFMSIGTLTAYSFVAACVIILRYSSHGQMSEGYTTLDDSPSTDTEQGKIQSITAPSESEKPSIKEENNVSAVSHNDSKNNGLDSSGAQPATKPKQSETSRLVYQKTIHNGDDSTKQELPARSKSDNNSTTSSENTQPSGKNKAGMLKSKFCGTFLDLHFGRYKPGKVVVFALLVSVCSSLSGMLLLSYTWEKFIIGSWWVVLLFVIFTLITIASLLLIAAHQQHEDDASQEKNFRVPLVPFLPYLCICTNLFFMIKLQYLTWIRLIIWVSVGLVIYFVYGYHFSQRNPNRFQPHWFENVCSKLQHCWIKCRSTESNDLKQLSKNDELDENTNSES
uniref:cationic amino acid transporter 4-like isoform X1 n=1 Tax=Styela clava TaxID=7725 RepID=UPI00193A3697|nr:cationic amino acid transporter 4-like isoform X1 [Styela clava]